MAHTVEDATNGLLQMRHRDETAERELFQRIYDELRRLAGRQMRGQPGHHTLQTTALAHEAYLRLIDQSRVDVADRGRFLGIAARAMRSVLVDHARRRTAEKRGGRSRRLPLDEALDAFEARSADLAQLDDALGELAEINLRRAHVVELKFFGGMTHEEVAAFLGISLRTVEREWRLARAWLRRRLEDGADDADQADGS
ncbi:MAG: sigma-70 family RNA polymerase sigma factor [Phycisphaerales bacterium]|nr:MAG: sigma-70 family RNA polymerase sigma factor [Phycisphaerales bacterium]